MSDVHIDVVLPPAVVETVAARAAEMLEERLNRTQALAMSPLMTIEEAAEYLRCGHDARGKIKRQRVDDLLSRGVLTRIKDGRRTLVLREEIVQHLARSRR